MNATGVMLLARQLEELDTKLYEVKYPGLIAARVVPVRTGIDPGAVDDVLMGCANPEGATGWNIARQVALRAGGGRHVSSPARSPPPGAWRGRGPRRRPHAAPRVEAGTHARRRERACSMSARRIARASPITARQLIARQLMLLSFLRFIHRTTELKVTLKRLQLTHLQLSVSPLFQTLARAYLMRHALGLMTDHRRGSTANQRPSKHWPMVPTW
jgi:hypothetical protein